MQKKEGLSHDPHSGKATFKRKAEQCVDEVEMAKEEADQGSG